MMWFHKLMNPHCEHCYQEQHSETSFLRLELEKAQRMNELLMGRLLEPPRAMIEPEVNKEPIQIKTGGIPWHVKRDQLEKEARMAASKLMEQRKSELSVEDIEKVLDIQEK